MCVWVGGWVGGWVWIVGRVCLYTYVCVCVCVLVCMCVYTRVPVPVVDDEGHLLGVDLRVCACVCMEKGVWV